MASVRGACKAPPSASNENAVVASKESEKQRLEREKREEKDRLIKRNLEKERIKKVLTV